ncbi:hypothetical protein O7A05_11085 [Mesorhizobium sp. Cs1330R2N1]|uniref:Uncharacterized protein n=1 Tax=Mesorhizobium argentiipisi TaxID=3015175 RepID=A0ABU8KBD5_9HYPH
MNVKRLWVEAPDFKHIGLHEEVQYISAGAAQSDDGDHFIGELRGKVADQRAAGKGVAEKENTFGTGIFVDVEREGVGVRVFVNGGPREDRQVMLDLDEEVGQPARWFVGKRPLHHNVVLGQLHGGRTAAEHRYRLAVQAIRHAAGKEDLMVLRPNPSAVDVFDDADDRAPA